MKFRSYGALRHMRHAWIFPWISHNMGKGSKICPMIRTYRYPYFFQAIRTSVPSNFHPMVCYIQWMVIFLHEFLIAWLNSVKGLIKWEKPGILIPILFLRYGLLSFRRTPIPWNTEKRHPPIFTLFSEYVSFHIKFRPNGPESTMYKQHLALINGTRKVFEYFLNISYPL